MSPVNSIVIQPHKPTSNTNSNNVDSKGKNDRESKFDSLVNLMKVKEKALKNDKGSVEENDKSQLEGAKLDKQNREEQDEGEVLVGINLLGTKSLGFNDISKEIRALSKEKQELVSKIVNSDDSISNKLSKILSELNFSKVSFPASDNKDHKQLILKSLEGIKNALDGTNGKIENSSQVTKGIKEVNEINGVSQIKQDKSNKNDAIPIKPFLTKEGEKQTNPIERLLIEVKNKKKEVTAETIKQVNTQKQTNVQINQSEKPKYHNVVDQLKVHLEGRTKGKADLMEKTNSSLSLGFNNAEHEVKIDKVASTKGVKQIISKEMNSIFNSPNVNASKKLTFMINQQQMGPLQVEVEKSNNTIHLKVSLEDRVHKHKVEILMQEMKEDMKERGVNVEYEVNKQDRESREEKRKEQLQNAKNRNNENGDDGEEFQEKLSEVIGGK